MRLLLKYVHLLGFSVLLLFGTSVASDSALRVESLDTVWSTVYTTHFDSTFGGLDWDEIRVRYFDLVAQAESDDEFLELANRMLQELQLSHYVVFRAEKKSAAGSPLFSPGSLGLDIRLLENEAIISSLKPSFPAERAGLKVGYRILSIDSVPVADLLAEAEAEYLPHYNERRKLGDASDKILNLFFGEPGDTVLLTHEDESYRPRAASLIMQERQGAVELTEELPPFYVDFASRWLDDEIGYIYFSAFVPGVEDRFIAAVDSMPDMRGLIIDLRGNPGGSHEVGETIAGRVVREETPFSIFRYRDNTVVVSLDSNPSAFDGPIAILIDVMNGSASERFTACMQAIGRAKVVGERSPGSVGPSNVKTLPNGASFMYLIAQSLSADSTVLEGYGVVPDFTVSLNREAMLAGVDTQLERAVEYIKSELD